MDQLNEQTSTLNTAADTLQTLFDQADSTDPAWQAQVQAQLAQLQNDAAQLDTTDLATAVTAYQTALDQITAPTQPAALADHATLTAYQAAVTTFVSQLQAVQTQAQTTLQATAISDAVNDTSATLTAAAAALNQAVTQVATAVNQQDQAAYTTATADLDTLKQTYDNALTAYNTAVTAYQTANPTSTIITVTAPTAAWTDFVAQAALQNQGNYQVTLAKYQALTDALAPVKTALATYTATVQAYNELLTTQLSADPASDLAALTAAQQTAATAVTDAQTALADSLTGALPTALADYQTAATAYQTLNGSTPVVDLAALTTLQTQVTTLQDQAKEDFTPTFTTNQANLAQLAALEPVLAAYQAVQTKVAAVNEVAKAQKAAVDAWNSKVAAAQADGRWALFFNGDDGLLALADQLVAANYAYADAINGTTTALTTKTITDTATGKAFDLTTAGSSTSNPDDALAAVMAQYQAAATQYNTTYAAQLPTATQVLDGVDATQLSLDYETDLTTLLGQVEGMLTQIGKLAADPAQNKIVTDRLDITSDTFTGTTDGSLEENAAPNGDPMQLTATMITLQGESDYSTLSTHTFANSTDIGNYVANVSLSLPDYQDNVTAVNGIVKTTLYDQTGVFDQLFAQTYTDIGALYAARNAGEPAPASATIQGLPTTFALDGVSYYLAAYSIMTEGNPLGQVFETSQIYTFTTTDPVAELEHNPLLLSANKINNVRLFFYFMPVSALPAAFAVQATAVQPLTTDFTPDTLTMTPLAVSSVTLTVPSPTPTMPAPITAPTFTAGTTVASAFEPDLPAVTPIATLALNAPVAPEQPTAITTPTLTPFTQVSGTYQTWSLDQVASLQLNQPETPEPPANVPAPPAPTTLATITDVTAPTTPEPVTTTLTPMTPPTAPTPVTATSSEMPQKPQLPQVPAVVTPLAPLAPEQPTPVTAPTPGLQPWGPSTDEPTPPVPPTQPVTPDTPDEPNEPNTPNNPEEPNEPNTPDTPEEPNEPNTPDTPEAPNEPNTPDTPDEPNEPNTPDTPEEPNEPNTPEIPGKLTASATLAVSNEPGQSDQLTTTGATSAAVGTLPQTGENNHTPTTLLGLLLLGATSLFGFKGKRRQD